MVDRKRSKELMRKLKRVQKDLFHSKYVFALEHKKSGGSEKWIIRSTESDTEELYQGLPVGEYSSYEAVTIMLEAVLGMHDLMNLGGRGEQKKQSGEVSKNSQQNS